MMAHTYTARAEEAKAADLSARPGWITDKWEESVGAERGGGQRGWDGSSDMWNNRDI